MDDYFYSTQYFKIGLAKDQRYFGYLFIKVLEKRVSLPDLTEDEQKDFFVLIKKLESFFKETFGAAMFNYSCLMNNAYRDGVVPQVHFHFRPRFREPVKVLGEEFIDPNFGEHYLSSSFDGKEVRMSLDVRTYIVNALQKYLENN